jgi:rubrerythrin
VALENAVEGCVRETFGVAMAAWQAREARDPVIARTMARIAQDEFRHADLGWTVAEWAEAKLDRAARARIHEAMDAAVEKLNSEDGRMLPVCEALAGLPSTERYHDLVAHFSGAMSAA